MEKEEYRCGAEKLRDYLKNKTIDAEIFSFETSCHSVEDAVKTVGAAPEDFVKNICLVDDLNRLIVAIVLGTSRVSRKKLSRALNINLPEFASPKQVEEKSGYPIGGVPPLGYEAIFVIDSAVMQKSFVYASAGSPYCLMKITPLDIYQANSGQVALIAEKER